MYNLGTTPVKYQIFGGRSYVRLLIVIILCAYFGYVIATKGFVEIVFALISVLLSLTIISLRTKQKNFFKGIITGVRALFVQPKLDILPVDIDIDENTISVTVKNADIRKKQPVDIQYSFNKSDISVVDIYTIDSLIGISASKCKVVMTNSENSNNKYCKTITRGQSSLVFYLNDCADVVFNDIKKYNYKFNDAKIETENENNYQKERQRHLDEIKKKTTK